METDKIKSKVRFDTLYEIQQFIDIELCSRRNSLDEIIAEGKILEQNKEIMSMVQSEIEKFGIEINNMLFKEMRKHY